MRGVRSHVCRATLTPAQRDEVLIRGLQPEHVSAAAEQVLQLVDAVERRMEYTHFVSLPLPALQPAVQSLQDAMRALPPLSAMPDADAAAWMTPPARFHVTLLMLKLPHPALVEAAGQVLVREVTAAREQLRAALPPSARAALRCAGLGYFVRSRACVVASRS